MKHCGNEQRKNKSNVESERRKSSSISHVLSLKSQVGYKTIGEEKTETEMAKAGFRRWKHVENELKTMIDGWTEIIDGLCSTLEPVCQRQFAFIKVTVSWQTMYF